MRRVREELAKYESIERKAAELEQLLALHEDEDKWYDHFIEALYTDTIQKKGALFVYDRDPEEEAWSPFANLVKSGNYVEHEIFESFRKLDDRSRSVLLRKSARRVNDMTSSEDTAPLLEKLDTMFNTFLEARERLEYEKVELAGGEELYQFYKNMTTKLHDMRRKLK